MNLWKAMIAYALKNVFYFNKSSNPKPCPEFKSRITHTLCIQCNYCVSLRNYCYRIFNVCFKIQNPSIWNKFVSINLFLWHNLKFTWVLYFWIPVLQNLPIKPGTRIRSTLISVKILTAFVILINVYYIIIIITCV